MKHAKDRFQPIQLMLAILMVVAGHCQAKGNFDHTHKVWDSWLKKYVKLRGSESRVDYASAKNEHPVLKGYLASLSKIPEPQFQKFSGDERLAFLINSYNAFTVDLILTNYPTDSIRSIKVEAETPWKLKFFSLLGSQRSLDEIEHNLIREKFNEPRIHFACNCAAIGCPALRNEAWVAPRLKDQFADATALFLKDSSRNRYDAKANAFVLSNIFNWYGGDFAKAEGSVQAFVAKRMGGDTATRKKMTSAQVSFGEYDWKLNDEATRKAE